MPRRSLLNALDQRVLIIDGAMGTSLQACPDCRHEDWLGRENCSEILTHSQRILHLRWSRR